MNMPFGLTQIKDQLGPPQIESDMESGSQKMESWSNLKIKNKKIRNVIKDNPKNGK